MSSPQLQTVLWVVQPVLSLVLATAMYRRGINKVFPVFFAYTMTQIGMFTVQYLVHEMAAGRVYFCVFWAGALINLIFEFKIIHEIYLDVFRPYHALKDLGTSLFKWAALVMVLVSAVLVSTDHSWVDPIGRNILMLKRCVQVIQCGLLLFLLAFCKPLGVSWRRLSFGVSAGFGFCAASQLIAYALFAGGHFSEAILSICTMSVYNLSIVVWFLYAIWNRRDLDMPILVPQRWEHALMDIQPRSETESLIPMFEHMVDRAFSKTQDEHA